MSTAEGARDVRLQDDWHTCAGLLERRPRMPPSSSCVARVFSTFSRKKHIDYSDVTSTQFSRCLSTFDLTTLGIGSTLGAGIYVVAGQVARETAGPAVVLSFLIAALASVMAGLCYAEFGARVPKTGSAYVYSYVAVGEFSAFVIGWNLILEYVIGTASVARSWSGYFDSLIDDKISKFFHSTMPMESAGLAKYPDFFAFGITMLLAVVLSIGVKESSRFNNIFTGVNLLVVVYVVICGLFKAKLANWTLEPADIPKLGSEELYTNGDGGFFPFGFSGMVSGAATCFYAFVGFDVIATTGEEVKNPQKAIPIGIILSLTACFLAYFSLSGVLTLMVPYYQLDTSAPLPTAFKDVGWEVAQYIIAVGAICGLSTSLLGAMFPLPRVIYAMASDGLIFRFLATMNKRFKTPLIATILSGLLAAIMATVFDVRELVDMMSIGTLLAYTLVAVCVLVLRYRPPPYMGGPNSMVSSQDSVGSSEEILDANQTETITTENANNYVTSATTFKDIRSTDDILPQPQVVTYTKKEVFEQIFRPSNILATELSSSVVSGLVGLLSILIIVMDGILAFLADHVANLNPWAITTMVVIALAIFTVIIIIWRQAQNTKNVKFLVPLVPFLPTISILVNIYLMMKLSKETWLRFAVWMALGFLIYFSYGIWHSSERIRLRQKEGATTVRYESQPADYSSTSNGVTDKVEIVENENAP